jgi:hypothetical protein
MMGMPDARESLESGFRSGRLKRLITKVYLAQAVLAVFLMILVVVLHPEASFYPMYIPFHLVIYVIVIMLFLVNLEAFFFKHLGIKYCGSDSERFLKTKSHQKKGIIVIIAALIIMLVSMLLILMIDQGIDSEGGMEIEGRGATSRFSSQDIFAISGITEIEVSSEEYKDLDVYILTKEQHIDMKLNLRVNQDEAQSFGVTNFSYKDEDFIDPDEYVVYVEVVDGGNANLTYAFDRSVSSNVSYTLMIFPILFVIVNLIWMVYLQPLKSKYRKHSIYE